MLTIFFQVSWCFCLIKNTLCIYCKAWSETDIQSSQYDWDFLALNINLLNKPEQLLFLPLLTTNNLYFSILKSTVLSALSSPAYRRGICGKRDFFLTDGVSVLFCSTPSTTSIFPPLHREFNVQQERQTQRRTEREGWGARGASPHRYTDKQLLQFISSE